MFEQLLFYTTEYTKYILVFLGILLLVTFLAKSNLLDHLEDKKPFLVSIVLISYLTLFTGAIGGYIRPYFVNFDDILSGGNHGRFGTGSFVGQDIVLTNRHVVNGCNKLTIKNKDDTFEGEILAIDKKHDLAFVKVNTKKNFFALLSIENPKLGDILIIPGYTSKAGKFYTIRAKVIKKTKDELEAASVRSRAGNSGSPVFNSKGYLVGVLWGGGGLLTSFAVMETLEEILEFSKESKIDLFSTPKQDYDFTDDDDFLNKVSVHVLCRRKS